ncbi:MAG: hypothetical protein CVT89_05125 [Candidatus Altiarchaeales archaeon HGW-Altiarchaeales-2]|nr:MAG: hypothetical protein CVT89_05125 [Candidatus Altiarchaeales archaeon HGW-Altiarchaeales-2]
MPYKTIKNLDEYFEPLVCNKIRKKLGKYADLTKTFIIEENYIDGWWREENSIYYSKTLYNETNKFSTRVHLVKEILSGPEGVNEDNYIGYLILRPIPVLQSIISKIIVKPLKEAFMEDDEKLEIYTTKCKFEIHIGGKKIEFLGFPFYQQDTMVSSCAHADILMVAEYMHRKFNTNRPLIKDFFSDLLSYSYLSHGRLIPSPGLSVDQISTILQKIGVQTKIRFPFREDLQLYEIEDKLNDFLESINSYIESGLPTILTVKEHVIVIIGHTLKADGEKDYIIYDDSGAFLKEIKPGKNPAFYAVVPYKELKEYLKYLIEEKHLYYSVASVNVEFERMYFPYEEATKVANLIEKEIIEKELSGIKEWIKIKKRRFLIADSNDFKIRCSEKGNTVFNYIPMPHYIWICELYLKDKEIIFDILIDASAHQYDIHSWIAIWSKGTILFNSRYTNGEAKNTYNINIPPFVYSNLSGNEK